MITKHNIPPELASDTRNVWWQIGKEYYQTDAKNGIVLEIRHIESGNYRWWLYDANSGDPEMPVMLEDKPTLDEALADAYDYLSGLSK
jgi:hypothetical protein